MKNLMQIISEIIGKKLVPLALATAITGGCATTLPSGISAKDNPPELTAPGDVKNKSKDNLVNLGNGYLARNYKVADTIDLITSALLGEVILKKTNKGKYVIINTRIYGSSNVELWDSILSQSCRFADVNNDYILEESEVTNWLDVTYETIEKRNNEVIWVEDDE